MQKRRESCIFQGKKLGLANGPLVQYGCMLTLCVKFFTHLQLGTIPLLNHLFSLARILASLFPKVWLLLSVGQCCFPHDAGTFFWEDVTLFTLCTAHCILPNTGWNTLRSCVCDWRSSLCMH